MNKTKETIMKETEALLADDAAVINVYERVLNGELIRFPRYIWDLPNSMYYAKVITRYLLEDKLKWSLEDIKDNMTLNILIKYRLLGMYKAIFSNVFDVINNAYPEKIKPWELPFVSMGFWNNDDNKRVALRWLFEEKLQWNIEDIKQKLTKQVFDDNGLGGLIYDYFDSSPYKAVDFLYPNQIKPWELQVTPNAYWKSDENKRATLLWLFKEKLNWNLEEIKQKLTQKVFEENGLEGLLMHYFDASPYKAVNFLYPNQIKLWELTIVPNGSWEDDNNKREALIWLFEERLQWSIEDINEKLKQSTFVENGLRGLLKCFNSSPYKAAKFLYPNEDFTLLEQRKKSQII